MATYRIGIGSFNLKDGAVGIGTETTGLGNLKVEGSIKTTDLDVTGVSTFQRYAGFAADDLNINRDTSLTGEHSTLGDIVVGLNSTFTVSTGATVDVGTVPSVSIGTHFSLPTGDMEDRPEKPVEGTVRFNKDLNTLEFYNGFEWRQFTVNGASGRGVWGGGYAPALSQVMDYVNIPTQGNAINFGQLNVGGASKGSMGSNGTRGLFMGGYWPAAPTVTNQIDYITIPSAGNGIDFGDLTESKWGPQGASSSTRGIRMGGFGATDVIDYVEISTVGNAIDFGNLTTTKMSMGVCSSPVKVFGGGGNNSGTNYSEIEMITTASKGNAVDDGDLTHRQYYAAAASNNVRGIWFGGADAVTTFTEIQYRTLSSSGTAQYFGELTQLTYKSAGASTQTRAVIGGGMHTDPGSVNTMQYVTIATQGNAVDFGDLTHIRSAVGGLSDSHGGLGGF